MNRSRGQVHHVGARFGRGPHRAVHEEAEQRPQRLDHEPGHEDQHRWGVGAQGARVAQVAGVDGHGGDVAESRVLGLLTLPLF